MLLAHATLLMARPFHIGLGLLVELLERFPICSFPSSKTVGASAVYDHSCRRRARKLDIFGESQKAIFHGKRALSNELLSLYEYIRIVLGGRSLL